MSTMGKIKSSTTNREIIVKRGIHGAQSRIKLVNDSNKTIKSENLIIDVDAPDGVFVDIGQSVEVDSHVFQPQFDLTPGRTLNLPIIIEVGIGREIGEKEIMIAVEFDDEYVSEDKIQIIA
ncbi:hypothetical protein [Natronococcus wangiae]|uniref:hypothetical protein n=1 Tax=Natronococcus wangiae TaxID=3068275 RepID=UPI00273D5DFE|nr:hypothetical protein [Natronococcus sp. AD5]